MQSERFSLNKLDYIAILKGLLITLLGAALTYLSEYVTKLDFGDYTPIVLTGFALLVNTIRKYITGK